MGRGYNVEAAASHPAPTGESPPGRPRGTALDPRKGLEERLIPAWAPLRVGFQAADGLLSRGTGPQAHSLSNLWSEGKGPLHQHGDRKTKNASAALAEASSGE